MANKKITQLTDIVLDIDNDDILHIIDDPNGITPINKKVSVANLRANTFSNIPNPLNISGLLNLTQTPETITADGAISITESITLISSALGPLVLTLANGSNGQLKFIVMTTHTGSDDAVITPTNLLGAATTLTFNGVGDSVLLLFTGGNWAVISNNGVTAA